MQFENGFSRKQFGRIGVSRQLQAAVDVATSLVQIEGAKVRTKRNSLLKLSEIGGIELLIQLLLSNEQNLQQFLARRFQVGQESDFLQNVDRKMVGFVHHQYGRETLRKTCNHVTAQIQQKLTLGFARSGKPEVSCNVLQELHWAQARVKDVRIRNIGARQYLKKAPDQKGLTRAHLARHDHEALASFHAVVERR